MREHVPAGVCATDREKHRYRSALCHSIKPSLLLYNAVRRRRSCQHFLHYFCISPTLRSVLYVCRPEVSWDKMKTDTSTAVSHFHQLYMYRSSVSNAKQKPLDASYVFRKILSTKIHQRSAVKCILCPYYILH